MSSEESFIFVLLASICLNHFLAFFIYITKGFFKKLVFFIAIGFNLEVLVHHKYLGFLTNDVLNPIKALVGISHSNLPSIVVPLALSFYTFHALSYLIDLYQGKIKFEQKIHKLYLYFLLFPHLVAGPIVRFRDISDQIDNRVVTLTSFKYGIFRFITGLGKKVIIANTLASNVDDIFRIPTSHMSMETAWLGIICFTLQIYFDFSGYSDIAIGIAYMLGFKFPENFNYPYIASSIGEFWRRWHITLSNWFRDYVYIPLGGNRKGMFRTCLNLVIVFILVGLWHGASWNFVVWGALHGTFMVLERIKDGKIINFLGKPFRHLYTIGVVTLSWVFFRSENLEYAVSYLKKLFIDYNHPLIEYRPVTFYLNRELIIILFLAILFSTPLFNKSVSFIKSQINHFNSRSQAFLNIIYLTLQTSYLIILLEVSLTYVASQTYLPFIYFKF